MAIESFFFVTVQVELERLVGHVLVYEQPLLAVDAVANEGDEVLVVHAADDLHLSTELAVTLPAPGAQLLDGHLVAAAHRATVHVPEPALPQQVGVREPVCGRRQVVVRERPTRGHVRRHRGLGRGPAALPRVHRRRRR
jgi:hypothetical protein